MSELESFHLKGEGWSQFLSCYAGGFAFDE